MRMCVPVCVICMRACEYVYICMSAGGCIFAPVDYIPHA